MATTNENAVTKEVFDTNTAAWQATSGSVRGMIGTTVLANLFNVPLVDLQEIISEMQLNDKAVSCDAFIGTTETSDGTGNQEMRLYFVGVDADGNNIFERPGPDGEMESAIYDMVMPCPPTCR